MEKGCLRCFPSRVARGFVTLCARKGKAVFFLSFPYVRWEEDSFLSRDLPVCLAGVDGREWVHARDTRKDNLTIPYEDEKISN